MMPGKLLKFAILQTLFMCQAYLAVINAQSFEVDQINQFFRPRVKMESRYYLPAAFKDTLGNFGLYDVQVSVTAPLKSSLDADLVDVIKNKSLKSVKIKQTLVTARGGYKLLNTGFDNNSPHSLINGSVGIMGISVNSKLTANFYSANIGFAEENNTFSNVQPRINGIIGQMKIKGIRKSYYYGFLLTYSDRLILPIPFFGADIPMSKNFSFFFTLPAQLGFNYKPNHKLSANILWTFDGFRSGYNYFGERRNVNFVGFQSAANVRYKLNKALFIKLEGGYDVRNKIRITDGQKSKAIYGFGNTGYLLLSLNMNFGKSVFEKIFN